MYLPALTHGTIDTSLDLRLSTCIDSRNVFPSLATHIFDQIFDKNVAYDKQAKWDAVVKTHTYLIWSRKTLIITITDPL